MGVHAVVQVLDQPSLASPALFQAESRHATQSIGDQTHLALFPVLPDPVGHVEQETLEEQHERYPLVVAVVRSLLVELVAKAGMGNGRAHLASMLTGQRESVRNPAVRVDHVTGNGAVVDAGNWIT